MSVFAGQLFLRPCAALGWHFLSLLCADLNSWYQRALAMPETVRKKSWILNSLESTEYLLIKYPKPRRKPAVSGCSAKSVMKC